MSRKIAGTAIVFGAKSLDLGGFIEVVSPQAVNRTFDEQIDVRALGFHDSAQLIGRLSAGTLTLQRSAKGLEAEVNLPRTATGDAILELARRRDLTNWSFGFTALADTWALEPGGGVLRTLTDMKVSEVSPVSWAAYPSTTLSVRSLECRQRSPAQEWSDDRERGQRQHASTIAVLRRLQRGNVVCTQCFKQPACAVRTTTRSVLTLCQRCAAGGSSLAMLEKRHRLAMSR